MTADDIKTADLHEQIIPPAPKVETATLLGKNYAIMFDLINGEPICHTVRMVKL